MTITRNQPPLGVLKWEERLRWWVSAPVAVPLFPGQSTHFSFPAEDQAAPIDEDRINALNAFLALTPAALAQIEPHTWVYYREVADEWEGAPKIERAALWRHVQLNGVNVTLGDDGLPYLNIECNCDWEPEHGLELVLQRGMRWTRVAAYSGHITDGDAFNAPELDAWMGDPNATLPVRTIDEILAIARNGKR